MDIRTTLAALLPAPEFEGSLTANTQDAYGRIRWLDARPKPAWADITAKWPEVEAALAGEATAAQLAATDFEMARVAEDLAEWSIALLDALLSAGAIDAAARAQLALPAGAIAKINARRAIRGEAAL